MIRLEDIGPGGNYGSLEGLGKLRAVMDYIEVKKIPYHMAVIPRWVNVEADGTWTERGIHDANPILVVRHFIKLLQTGEKQGAILGMHGYSHQFGDSIQASDNQNSGTGDEFHVKGNLETKERSIAANALSKVLQHLKKLGYNRPFGKRHIIMTPVLRRKYSVHS